MLYINNREVDSHIERGAIRLNKNIKQHISKINVISDKIYLELSKIYSLKIIQVYAPSS